jgi:hypothetical protein
MDLPSAGQLRNTAADGMMYQGRRTRAWEADSHEERRWKREHMPPGVRAARRRRTFRRERESAAWRAYWRRRGIPSMLQRDQARAVEAWRKERHLARVNRAIALRDMHLSFVVAEELLMPCNHGGR